MTYLLVHKFLCNYKSNYRVQHFEKGDFTRNKANNYIARHQNVPVIPVATADPSISNAVIQLANISQIVLHPKV